MNTFYILDVLDNLLPELRDDTDIQQQLIGLGETIVVEKKEQLSTGEDPYDKYVHMVLEGALMQCYSDSSTKRAADFFFEKTIFVFDQNLHAIPGFNFYFEALEPSRIMRWDRSNIRARINPDLLNKLWIRWYQKCFLPDTQLRRLLLLLPSARFYNYLLQNKPELIQRVPQKYIAEYMSISAEHLSRLRKNLT